MSNEILKKEISKFYKNKTPTEKDYRVIIRMIYEFKKENPLYFHQNMGKILLKKGDLENARHHLEIVKNLNPNYLGIYYQLYKLEALDGNLERAYQNIIKYKEVNEKRNVKINIDIPLILLEIANNKGKINRNLHMDSTNYLYTIELKNKKVLELYHNLIEKINQGDFLYIKKILKNMNILIYQNNIPVEVDTLQAIERNIKINIQDQLIKIDQLIEIDLENAKERLQELAKRSINGFYSIEINLLVNKIKEKEIYNSLNKDQKTMYNLLKKQARNYYEKEDYPAAYDCYEAASYITEHPIFDYYLGKMLYKAKRYEDALSFFQKYYFHGGEKTTKCLLYMRNIYDIQQKRKKSNEMYHEMQKIHQTFKNDFQLKIGKETISKNEKNAFDYEKYYKTKKTKIALEEFTVDPIIDIESYENYDFEQKLLVIKQLFQHHQEAWAEKKLQNIIPENKEEQAKLQQFQRNKKLYKNKRG